MNATEEARYLKQWTIGLTGGIATGKSRVARYLVEQGHPVCDADQLARQVVRPGSQALNEIVQRFGPHVVDAAGELQRAILRSEILASEVNRTALNAIMHPAIRGAFFQWLAQQGLVQRPVINFYEAALLVETGTHKAYRALWVTVCRAETQVERLVKGRSLSQAEAQQLVASQMPADQKARYADLVIDSEKPWKETEVTVKNALATL